MAPCSVLKGPEALPCVNNGLFCKSIENESLNVHAKFLFLGLAWVMYMAQELSSFWKIKIMIYTKTLSYWILGDIS